MSGHTLLVAASQPSHLLFSCPAIPNNHENHRCLIIMETKPRWSVQSFPLMCRGQRELYTPATNTLLEAGLQGEAALLPQVSSAYGMLGNIDANTGDAQTGWDTDQARPGPSCLSDMHVHV